MLRALRRIPPPLIELWGETLLCLAPRLSAGQSLVKMGGTMCLPEPCQPAHCLGFFSDAPSLSRYWIPAAGPIGPPNLSPLLYRWGNKNQGGEVTCPRSHRSRASPPFPDSLATELPFVHTTLPASPSPGSPETRCVGALIADGFGRACFCGHSR